MADVDMRKVETVIRRLMKEYGIDAKMSGNLQDAIEDVIRSENDAALKRFATAFQKNIDKTKVWRYYLEA